MKDFFAMVGLALTVTVALLLGSSLVSPAEARERGVRKCITYVRTIDGGVQCIRFHR